MQSRVEASRRHGFDGEERWVPRGRCSGVARRGVREGADADRDCDEGGSGTEYGQLSVDLVEDRCVALNDELCSESASYKHTEEEGVRSEFLHIPPKLCPG